MARKARRFHFALTTLGCFGGGSLYGWSGLLPAVRATFDVSNATASMVFSLALISFTSGVLLGPMLFALVPSRFRLSAIAGCAAISLGLTGSSQGFNGFVLSYGILFGFVSGVLYNHAISQAAASEDANLLVPVNVAAFGLGGAVFGPIHVWLAASGWSIWATLPALVCLGAVCILAMFVSPNTDARATARLQSARMIKPNRTLVALWIVFAAGSCSGLIVLGFAAQILPQTAGGTGVASLAIFLAALGNSLGRLTSAVTTSMFGAASGIAGALALSMMALASLIFATAPFVVVMLLFFVAFAYGQLAATTPLLVRLQVRDAEFPASFGLVFTGWGVAGLVGPWTAGWLLDVSGTLQFALISCIALSFLSLCMVLPFTRRTRAK